MTFWTDYGSVRFPSTNYRARPDLNRPPFPLFQPGGRLPISSFSSPYSIGFGFVASYHPAYRRLVASGLP